MVGAGTEAVAATGTGAVAGAGTGAVAVAGSGAGAAAGITADGSATGPDIAISDEDRPSWSVKPISTIVVS